MSITASAAGMLVCPAACAEPVKITNIGHGYFSAALYIAKQEKISRSTGSSPISPTCRAARWRCRRR